MLRYMRPAALLLIILSLITGVIYPLFTTLIAQVAFPAAANGSLITVDDAVVGSALIGQSVNNPTYFWSRPSAVNYMQDSSPEALGSSGATNAGSTSAALAEAVEARAAAFREAHNLPADVAVPGEMLFASGSGLDPHISPEAARLQIERVAAARDLTPETVAALVESHVETPQLGFLGQPRVNVLLLNLALDELQ